MLCLKGIALPLRAVTVFSLIVMPNSPALSDVGKPAEPKVIIDKNGINLITGQFYTPDFKLEIGEESQGGLVYRRWRDQSTDNWSDTALIYQRLSGFGSSPTVSVGKRLYQFPNPAFLGGSVYGTTVDAIVPDGSTLLLPNSANFVLTLGDGTIISSNEPCHSANALQIKDKGVVAAQTESPVAASIQRPNGEIIRFTYLKIYDAKQCLIASRLQSMRNNYGYQLHFDYASNDSSLFAWRQISAVTAINGRVDYCSDTAVSCPGLANVWPKMTFSTAASPQVIVAPDSTTTISYTDQAKQTFQKGGVEIAKYDFNPAGAPAKISVIKDGKTWWYDKSVIGAISVTDPLGSVSVANSSPWNIRSFTDENGLTTNYRYYSDFGDSLLQYIVPPEGQMDSNGVPVAGYTKFDYDARGNIIQTTMVAKSGSGLSPISTAAIYESGCSIRKTCNLPIWRQDAKGNRTDYTYAAAHGGVLTEMRPAPNAGEARPLTVKTYAQRYAWIKNASGVLVQESSPVWVPSTVTECQTGVGSSTPVCDGAAQRAVTTYEYGANGTAESLLIKGARIVADGVTLRTCYVYDIYGRKISETKPNANLSSCS